MARKITEDDIVAALNGTPSVARERDAGVVEALRGPSAAERQTSAIEEALSGRRPGITSEGGLPLQERGDDLEAVAIWAAKEAALSATKTLAEAIMRADANKGIYAAESEARDIAAEAYTAAAEATAYEDVRQEHVKKAVTAVAESLGRKRQQEALGTQKKATPAAPRTVTETVPGKRRTVSTSTMNGHQIISYR